MSFPTENRAYLSPSKSASDYSGEPTRKRISPGTFVPFLLFFRPSIELDVHPQPKVVCSGNLMTGQNPESARPLAKKMKEMLQSGNA